MYLTVGMVGQQVIFGPCCPDGTLQAANHVEKREHVLVFANHQSGGEQNVTAEANNS